MRLHDEQVSALRQGALASASLLVGLVPWGIVAGVAMVSAELTQAQAVAMSVLVFAGSARLAVLPLCRGDAQHPADHRRRNAGVYRGPGSCGMKLSAP